MLPVTGMPSYASSSSVRGGPMMAYNTFQASDELVRVRDSIRWMDGYGESCLEGNERAGRGPAGS